MAGAAKSSVVPTTVSTTIAPLKYKSVNLEDGWHSADATYHAGNPELGRDPSGIVHLIGSIQGGYSNLPAFVLPTADNPAHVMWFLTMGAGPVCIKIDQRGEATECNGNYMFMTGVTFPAANSKLSFKRMTLTHGWISQDSIYSTGDPSAARDPSGIVHMSGALANGTGSAFVLPQGMRPSHTVYVPTYVGSGEVGALRIATTGRVTPMDSTGGSSAQSFTSLAGVTFVAGNSNLSAKPLKLGSGWASGQAGFGTGNPSVVEDNSAIVHFEGSLVGTGTPSPVAFRLPTALRPTHVVHLLAYGKGSQPVSVTVKPTGGVVVSGTSATALTSLEGLQFSAGQ